MQLLYAWLGGYLWIIPLGMIVGIIISVLQALKQIKSGSGYRDPRTGQWVDTPGNMKFWQLFSGRVAIVLFILLMVVLKLMYNDR
jgi:hypothetical protein